MSVVSNVITTNAIHIRDWHEGTDCMISDGRADFYLLVRIGIWR